MSTLLSASVMCADLMRLPETFKTLDGAGVNRYHWDIMDGQFVPNFALTPLMMGMARGLTDTPFEAHLMIANPEPYIEMTAKAGAELIIVHAEPTRHLGRVLGQIKAAGCKAGVALNPATPPHLLRYVLTEISTVLVMTVEPGFAGGAFVRAVVPKVREVRALIDELRAPVEIAVDGHINGGTIPECARAGANVFVLGSTGLFNQADLGSALAEARRAAQGSRQGLA